ncbi:MAG: hypothetical protein AAF596_04265 [Planctomycetota bacterium]
MPPTLENRQNFALWSQSQTCFKNAVEGIEYIVDNDLQQTDFLYGPLSTWTIIQYAKPFTNNRGFERLDKKIVPEAYQDCHEFVIESRNKIAAHMDGDASSLLGSEARKKLHRVNIAITEDNKIVTLAKELKIGTQVIHEFHALAKKMLDKAVTNSRIYAEKVYDKLRQKRLRPGEYEISLDPKAKNWFRQLPRHEK